MAQATTSNLVDLATAIRGVGGKPSNAAHNIAQQVVAQSTANGAATKFWATKEEKAKIALGLAMGSHMYFYGPAGVGKTTTAMVLMENSGMPYYRFQGYEGLTADDWYGSATLDSDGKISINYSNMVKAVEEGSPVIVEEMNLVPPSQTGPLFSFLDHTPWVDVTIAGKTKRVVKKKGFRLIVTANDNGSGDQLHLYGGGQLLNKALASRFGLFMKFGYLPQNMELEMVAEFSGLHESTLLGGMLQVANETRRVASSDPSKAELAISPRNMIDWARAYKINDEAQAGLDHTQLAEIILINRLPDTLQGTMKTLVENKLRGSKLTGLKKAVS
ncbi:MAG: AAA family ATPase [Candidatus Neomarinimicrobiota bacterium]|jgi:MoxR-like ATPase